ncbi:hypothetical protein [Sutcliffiella rhizosphaerae]|uniref:Uncharacterized protein n=1 Tax=Sutcliffiella rhizosphaerae TaxID=2880967 RepID=A0ABN8AFK1_9BACI|nr:hypothetical protein [Sutcliffiella rhizosphaerae]CAG9622979.1 hypothetical protein BACCIP111883_03774 [Sutcliffiella rhizosphaerae]
MEFYLDLLLYAPYVTAAIICLVNFYFYLDSNQLVYQYKGYTTSLVVGSNIAQFHLGKRRRFITLIYRKRPTKESTVDEEDSSFYFSMI